ncbi:MAG TPA: DUF6659 family protein [Nitrosopumilaceae archaeon]|nr:DUF6659 family protein [Nitrosopumilaceae archaeon]
MLELKNVRFAGLISNYGNLYVGGFKEGIDPYESNEKRRLMYMRFALESSFRNDFDGSLGEFKNSIIQRANVSIITMNICSYLLLVFADPDIDTKVLLHRLESIIKNKQKSFSNL